VAFRDENDDELNHATMKASALEYDGDDDMTFVYLGAACFRDDHDHEKSFILALVVNLLLSTLLRHIYLFITLIDPFFCLTKASQKPQSPGNVGPSKGEFQQANYPQ
jgi:hypothetical protein